MGIQHGNIKKVLVALAFPISIGMITSFLFQLVDSYFIGKVGADALAAVGYSTPIITILMSLFMGFATGVSIIIGNHLGSNSTLKILISTKYSLLISFICTIFISLLAYFFLTPILSLLGINSEVILHLTFEYTAPLVLFMVFYTLAMLINGILRAKGIVVWPQIVMVAAGFVNFGADYVLIFGNWGFPELGIKGAAYASVFSWFTMFIGMLFLLVKHKMISVRKIKNDVNYSFKNLLVEIENLALPAVLTQVITPITMLYLTYILGRQDELAVAAYGVASRIQILLMVGALSLGAAITPFIALNKGANQHQRIAKAIRISYVFNLYVGGTIALVLFLFTKPIVRLFTQDAQIIIYASNYFYILAISYVFFGFYNVVNSALNGVGKTRATLKINLVQAFALIIPLTLIGSYFWEVNGIFLGTALSYILTAFYAKYQMKISCINHNINNTK